MEDISTKNKLPPQVPAKRRRRRPKMQPYRQLRDPKKEAEKGLECFQSMFMGTIQSEESNFKDVFASAPQIEEEKQPFVLPKR